MDDLQRYLYRLLNSLCILDLFPDILLCFSRPSWPVFWGFLPLMVMISVRNKISSCLKKTCVDPKARKHLLSRSAVASHWFITFCLKIKYSVAEVIPVVIKIHAWTYRNYHKLGTLKPTTCSPHETRFFLHNFDDEKFLRSTTIVLLCSRLFLGGYHEGHFRRIPEKKAIINNSEHL